MEYEIKRSSRKTVALEITDRATLLVRAPLKMSGREIEKFVLKYSDWIDEKLRIAQKRSECERALDEREEELRKKPNTYSPCLRKGIRLLWGLSPRRLR